MLVGTDQYLEKQRQRYQDAMTQGHVSSAHDALWRAASSANLLEHWEVSSEGFTEARVAQLTQALGW